MTTEDKSQDQEILRIRDSLKGKVPWIVFAWAMGIMVVGMGWIMNSSANAEDKVDAAVLRVGKVETKIEVIANDVGWIRKYIETGGRKTSSIEFPLQ